MEKGSIAFVQYLRAHLASLDSLTREELIILATQCFEVPPIRTDTLENLQYVIATKQAADQFRRQNWELPSTVKLALTILKERPCSKISPT